MGNMASGFRIDHDLPGGPQIPAHDCWGIHTARAIENFAISGASVIKMPDLIRALGYVKKAAARANAELGARNHPRATAMMNARARLIEEGKFHDQFLLEVARGGASTSTDMNANDVVANIALASADLSEGREDVLHLRHRVNASRSTNDVCPTRVSLALWFGRERLLTAMVGLRGGFEARAAQFNSELKSGRTQPQDAVPMTPGREFFTYAVIFDGNEARLRESRALIREINFGASAMGTGRDAPAGNTELACRHLAEQSGVPVVQAHNPVEATQDTDAFVQLLGVLKRVATKLSESCNDLRLLAIELHTGFGDIRLLARQAESSVVPGKVNPAIPDVMNPVAFEVISNDITVTMASEVSQLQLNAFEPVLDGSLFKSIKHLSHACRTLQLKRLAGIEGNHGVLSCRVAESIRLVTAIKPHHRLRKVGIDCQYRHCQRPGSGRCGAVARYTKHKGDRSTTRGGKADLAGDVSGMSGPGTQALRARNCQ